MSWTCKGCVLHVQSTTTCGRNLTDLRPATSDYLYHDTISHADEDACKGIRRHASWRRNEEDWAICNCCGPWTSLKIIDVRSSLSLLTFQLAYPPLGGPQKSRHAANRLIQRWLCSMCHRRYLYTLPLIPHPS